MTVIHKRNETAACRVCKAEFGGANGVGLETYTEYLGFERNVNELLVIACREDLVKRVSHSRAGRVSVSGDLLETVGHPEVDKALLARALCEIDAQLQKGKQVSKRPIPQLQAVYAPWQVADLAQTDVIVAQADGCVSAEYVWAYPPGIPLIVPGERIDQNMLQALDDVQACGTELHSTSRGMPGFVRVVIDEET